MRKKNELMVFENEMFGNVRVLEKNGEIWFLAKDLAKCLDISDVSSSTRDFDEDEKGKHTMQTLGGEQKVTVLSESGMYRLVLKSRKSEAKKFKRWVTHDVIPSIRKHGVYMTSEVIEKTLSDPDFIIKLATQLKEEKQKRLEAEKTNRRTETISYFCRNLYKI